MRSGLPKLQGAQVRKPRCIEGRLRLRLDCRCRVSKFPALFIRSGVCLSLFLIMAFSVLASALISFS